MNRVRKDERTYTPNLDLVQTGQVIHLGYADFHVLDEWDSKSGRCVWLEIQRLSDENRTAGKAFRIMIPKRWNLWNA